MPKMSKSWIVTFDIKVTGILYSGYATIMNIGIGRGDSEVIIVFNFRPSSATFLIATYLNGKKRLDASANMQLHKWHNVIAMQYKNTAGIYVFTIFINKNKLVEVINGQPHELMNANVWVGDPWNEPAIATIKNLFYSNLE